MTEKESTTPESTDQEAGFPAPSGLSTTNAIIIGLIAIIIVMAGFLLNSDGTVSPPVASASASEMATATASPAAIPEAVTAMPRPATMTASHGGIERQGEGRLFYTTIKIPAGAETLYLSGSGASMKADGTWGNMEEQAIDTFNKFKGTLEVEGWSMADIVQVRAFAVAGEYGLLDFDGFNRGYSQFFGTQDNPSKPVRSFVQVADLVVDGWLVEVEIRAARMPK